MVLKVMSSSNQITQWASVHYVLVQSSEKSVKSSKNTNSINKSSLLLRLASGQETLPQTEESRRRENEAFNELEKLFRKPPSVLDIYRRKWR